jgi:hypothetical protein
VGKETVNGGFDAREDVMKDTVMPANAADFRACIDYMRNHFVHRYDIVIALSSHLSKDRILRSFTYWDDAERHE